MHKNPQKNVEELFVLFQAVRQWFEVDKVRQRLKANKLKDLKRKPEEVKVDEVELNHLPLKKNQEEDKVDGMELIPYPLKEKPEDDKMDGVELFRRPDMKALAIMKKNNLRAYTAKMIGRLPGVEVGDIFYYRAEMCLVRLHYQIVSGIDYMKIEFGNETDTVAVCIVSSGGYENVEDDVNVLVYSGHGGGAFKNDRKPAADQELKRGNLALVRSLHRKNEIRVVRSITEGCNKIYVYDGIYKVENYWLEKGKSGHGVYMFKLVREPKQPDEISVWKKTQDWKKNPSTRGNVISPDLSSGVERLPVCLVNEEDDEKGPSHFNYITKVNYLNSISSKKLEACLCRNICTPGDANCSCLQRNGHRPPFDSNGFLVRGKPIIYECNAACRCSKKCGNRVTQKVVKLHFEVFRTKDTGWGLRSWDPIKAGTFICEYTGEIIDSVAVQEDDYLFHTINGDGNRLNQNFAEELIKDRGSVDPAESFKPLPIILSAKKMGNISRFINHSCSPNIFWQPVLRDHGSEGYPHFMFFAIKHIPPMVELTYDYGTSASGIGI